MASTGQVCCEAAPRKAGTSLDNGFARRRGVLKMCIRTSSEFLLLHRAPPLGWTVPHNLRGKGITSRPSPPEYVSPPPTVILGPTTRPLRVAVRTRLTDASAAPSQPGTACAVAVRAEWSIENLGDGIAVPMQPDLPVRSITPRWRARERHQRPSHAFRASAAHGLKEKIGREARVAWPRRGSHWRKPRSTAQYNNRHSRQHGDGLRPQRAVTQASAALRTRCSRKRVLAVIAE